MITRRRQGFTLVELLIVIGIIAVLIAILLPAMAAARSQLRLAMCQSNLRQLSQAMLNYSADNDGWVPVWDWEFPDHFSANTTGFMDDSNFVEKGIIWKYTGDRRIYVCPEYPLINQNRAGTLWGFPPQWTYQVNGQPGYCMDRLPWMATYQYSVPGLVTKISRIRPSTQRVFMLMEQDINDYSCWDNGVTLCGPVTIEDIDLQPDSLGQFHHGGGNMAFFDGHVEWIRRDDYMKRVSTVQGTLNLWGGYVGFFY